MATRQVNTARWIDFLALGLAALAALEAAGGAAYFYAWQARVAGSPVWPLPALALLDWAAFSLGGFLATFFAVQRLSVRAAKAAWVCSGALLPLVILGAFSIGAGVLISFLLLFTATLLISARRGYHGLGPFGLLLSGAIFNLGLFLIFFALAQPNR